MLLRQSFTIFLFIMTTSTGSVMQNENERVISAPLNKLAHRSTTNDIERKSRAVNDEQSNREKRFTNDPSCGTVPISLSSPRIVNGQDSERGMWPWMVMMLRINALQTYTQLCGASLINRRWVITAAHCFFGEPYSDTQLALGAVYRNLTEDSVKRVAIDSIHCHPDYNSVTNENDICLLKLAGEISYTDYIVPTCLPENNSTVPDDTNCTVIGWGNTQGTADNAVLQEAIVKIINKTLCVTWYSQVLVDIPENHICAGFPNGVIDSCQGDSGGPLVCPYPTQSTPYVLNGITSFGVGCAEKERPGVYLTVARYLDWIENMITANNADTNQCFSISTISCNTTVTQNGTIIRTPVENTETWLYPANADCTWTISAPDGYYIHLNFMCHFQIETSGRNDNRCYDAITIFAPGTVISHDKCGSRLPQDITIPNKEAFIHFQSDSTEQSYGFVIEVSFVPDGQGSTASTVTMITESTFPTTEANAGTATPNNSLTVESTSLHDETENMTVNVTQSSTIQTTLRTGITNMVENVTNMTEATVLTTDTTQNMIMTTTVPDNLTAIQQTSTDSLTLNTTQNPATIQVLDTTSQEKTMPTLQATIVNTTYVSTTNTTSSAMSSLQGKFGIAICTYITVIILGNIFY